jgi:hypothetical protein
LFSLPAQFNSFSSTSWQEDASLPEILELWAASWGVWALEG